MLRRVVLTGALTAIVAMAGVLPTLAEEIEIRGKVLGPDGRPHPEATVSLHPSDSPYRQSRIWFGEPASEPAAEGRTDASGEFLLNAPAAGLWTVRIEAPGLVSLVHRLEPLVEPQVLPTARMETDGGLTVHVTGAEGRPVAGALVRLYRPTSRMERILRPGGWRADTPAAPTGDDGSVQLQRDAGDRRSVAVSAEGYRAISRPTAAGTGMTVRLQPGKAKRVTVVERAGEKEIPVADVLVTDRESEQPLGFTGKDGAITVYASGGGRYPLSVISEDGRSTSGSGQRFVLPRLETMVGQLIDSSTRSPIPGGLVWPEGSPWKADTTDRAGGFVLRGTRGSKIRIKADATGYLPADEVPFQFADDGRAGPILPLVLGAAVEGTVVDQNGRGLGEVSLGMKVKQSSPGMMRIEIGGAPPPRAVTDEHGRFRLSKIDTSKNWDVTASAEGYVKGKTSVIGLEPGRTRSGLRIQLDSGAQLTGTVMDGEGAPVSDAAVRIERSAGRRMGGMMILGGGPDKADGFTDEEGRFALTGLPQGNGELTITRKGFARLKVPGIDIPAGGSASDLGEFRLEPGARVQGMVVDTDGLPVENAEVQVAERGGGPRMMLMGIGDEPPEARDADGVSGPDGWFTLEDQPLGGEIALTVTHEGFLRADARVTEIPNAEPLIVTMDPSSTLTGIVLDPEGEPVPAADVNLTRQVQSGAGGMQMMMVMTEGTTADAEGRFKFEGLEPGKISLSASASGFQESKIDGVEIVKGEDLLEFELPLRAGAVLVGQVLTPDGKPAIGATVSIVSNSSEPVFDMGPARAASDGGGNYRLEGLPPGPVSIEATHDSYVRTVKDIEAEQGINALDFQFEGGQEVSGIVTGPDGAPVPGASVRLDSAGRQWGGPTADAGADGSFGFPGVADGEYVLTAGAEGFAPPTDKVKVHVGGEPVAGLTVRLQGAASIVGRLIGLDPSEYPQAGVSISGGPGQWGESRVDSEGRFRIDGLGAGSYELRAVGSSGNQARARAVLEPGQTETSVDIEFGQGVVLSGRALLGDRPFTEAMVSATGTDVSHVGWGETDGSGSFRLTGLKPGTYDVMVRQWKTGVSYEESVEVTSNRDIELKIPTAFVSGVVVDTADQKPLPGVRVALAPPDGPADTFFDDHVGVTDMNGRFTIGNVADGAWSLVSTKKGYATGRRDVVLQMGTDVGNLRLELEPTEGLTLQVRLPSGAIPSTVLAAVIDPAGRALSNGSYSTGENGSVRLSSVPRGSWEVVLYAPGSGVLRINADAPGGPLAVQLPRPTALSVTVPDLEGSDTRATVTVTDSAGIPFRNVEWYGEPVSQWNLRDGRRLFETLPPGTWNVRVDAADGRNWQGSGTSTPETPAEVVLR